MNLSPMLAASMPRTWNDEKFFKHIATKLPLIIQPKLDGIRCIINEHHVPLSRYLKPIRNKWIREQLTDLRLPVGFDGELLTYSSDGKVDGFNAVSSNVMSERGTPNFRYHVFDWMRPGEFLQRKVAVDSYFDAFKFNSLLVQVKSELCSIFSDIEYCLSTMIYEENYEGIIIRSPYSPYKRGRSTFNEFFLVKYKPWERSEATIVGFEELMINENAASVNALGHIERASGAHNLKPSGILGALVCKSPEFKETFKVGTGFTDDVRRILWRDRVMNMNDKITFKYQANRTKKDRPISPVFEGFVI